MKIQAANNYQNRPNQTNFQARMLRLGDMLIPGDHIGIARIAEGGEYPRNVIYKVIIEGDSMHTTKKVIANIETGCHNFARTILEKLAPKLNEAKHTTGDVVDTTDLNERFFNLGIKLDIKAGQ